MIGILGKKLGMTQVYDENNRLVPVTVVQAGPCTVTDVLTEKKNGYSAVQLGYGKRNVKNVKKPVLGHLKKSAIHTAPPARIAEIRCDKDEDVKLGTKVDAGIFTPGDFVDVIGTSKGKGFQGVVKRYNFAGGRASHGGDWLRKPGAIGMCEFPAKVYKGRKMPGQMGNKRCTVQSLQVVDVRVDENLLLIKGAVPGARNSYLIVHKAKKK